MIDDAIWKKKKKAGTADRCDGKYVQNTNMIIAVHPAFEHFEMPKVNHRQDKYNNIPAPKKRHSAESITCHVRFRKYYALL